MADQLEEFRDAKYMSLTSYRKDGTGVPTTVWFALLDGRLVMRTDSESYKVKRMRRNPSVTVAPSTARGEVQGEAVPGEAKELSPAEGAQITKVYLRRYPIGYSFEIAVLRPMHALLAAVGVGRRRGKALFFEIVVQRAVLALAILHVPEAVAL